MTWIAFSGYLGFIAYCTYFILPEHLEKYTLLITSFTGFSTAIVGSYFGFATFDDVKNREVEEAPEPEEEPRPRRRRGRREEEPPCPPEELPKPIDPSKGGG